MRRNFGHVITYLQDLIEIGVESSLSTFRNCFSVLSFSFDQLTVEQLGEWIAQLQNPSLAELWARQKEMKHPSFILYFAMWHYRDKALHEKGYIREVLEKLIFYDVIEDRVEVLAIVPKSEVENWLKQTGESDEEDRLV